MQVNTFFPLGATVNLVADTSSDRVALTAYDPALGTVRVYNAGTVDVFIAFGDSSVTVTAAAGMPVKAGNTEVFGLGSTLLRADITPPTHVAMIVASDTAQVYLTSGVGA